MYCTIWEFWFNMASTLDGSKLYLAAQHLQFLKICQSYTFKAKHPVIGAMLHVDRKTCCFVTIDGFAHETAQRLKHDELEGLRVVKCNRESVRSAIRHSHQRNTFVINLEKTARSI